MRAKLKVEIYLWKDLDIPTGGSPAECDATAVNLAVDNLRRSVHDEFAEIIEDEEATLSVCVEEIDE